MRDEVRAKDILSYEEIMQFRIFTELGQFIRNIEKIEEIDLSDFVDVTKASMRNLEKEIGKRILDLYWEEDYQDLDILKYRVIRDKNVILD